MIIARAGLQTQQAGRNSDDISFEAKKKNVLAGVDGLEINENFTGKQMVRSGAHFCVNRVVGGVLDWGCFNGLDST